jgi:succinate-acetate transporter protein
MKSKGHILMALSVIALILAAVDFIAKMDIAGLAGTQWILISILFAVYGNHAETCGVCGQKNSGN